MTRPAVWRGALALLVLAAPLLASGDGAPTEVTLDPISRHLALFEPGPDMQSTEDVRALLESAGIDEYGIFEMPDERGWIVSFRPPGAGPHEEAAEALEEEPAVAFVERDRCREYLPREGVPGALAALPPGAAALPRSLSGVVRDSTGAPLSGATALLQPPTPTPEGFVAGAQLGWRSARDAAGPVFSASDAAGGFRLAASSIGDLAPGAPVGEEKGIECRCLLDDEEDPPHGPPDTPPDAPPGDGIVQRPGGYPPGPQPPLPQPGGGPGPGPEPDPAGPAPYPLDDGNVIVAWGWDLVALPIPVFLPPIVIASGGAGDEPSGGTSIPPIAEVPEGTTTEDPQPPPPETPEGPPPETPGGPPPTVPDERPRACCGLFGDIIFYPHTDDPLEPPEVQEAFHEPAIAGHQVFLHDGAFYESADDLFVHSVGMDFLWKRQYRSNVKTKQGGLIGRRWDFAFNKRIVPINPTKPIKGLWRETLGGGIKPALFYYNGYGRRDRYEEAHSEMRKVRNFGVDLFEAYVTTYTSPPGAFHEIQRYVLKDERQPHPFARHENVERDEFIFYVLRDKFGFRYVFNCRGQLIYVADRFENLITLFYRGQINPLTQSPMLSQIVDTAGRPYEIGHVPIGEGVVDTNFRGEHVNDPFPILRIESVTDPDRRKVVFHYDRHAGGPRLEKVSYEPYTTGDLAAGVTYDTLYGYTDEGLLETITAPKQAVTGGPAWLTNHYAGERIGYQTVGGTLDGRAAGGDHVFVWGAPIAVTDRSGNRREYHLKPVAQSQVVEREVVHPRGDGRPWTTRYEHDPDYLVTKMELPRGNHIEYVYDDAGGPVTRGEVRNWLDRGITYENPIGRNLRQRIRVSHDKGDPHPRIATKYDYEPLFNQVTAIENEKEVRLEKVVHETFPNSFFEKVSGNNGQIRIDRIPSITRPGAEPLTGLTMAYTYDLRTGLLRTSRDTGGHVTTWAYKQPEGYMASVIRPNGSRIVYETDSRGNLERVTNPRGKVTRYRYDKRDLLARQVDDETGCAISRDYLYDRNENVIEAKVDLKDCFERPGPGRPGPEPRFRGRVVTTTRYDLLDRMVERVVDAGDTEERTAFSWDGNGNLLERQQPSPAGEEPLVTRFHYDARDLVEQIDWSGGGGFSVTEFRDYDDNGNLEKIYDPRCESRDCAMVTTTLYDGFDRERGSIDAAGAERSLTLDKAGNALEMTFSGSTGDEAGGTAQLQRTTYVFDELERMTTMTQYVLGDDPRATVETSWIYDADGLLENQVGPGIRRTEHTYDALHLPRTRKDGAGNLRTWVRNDAGDPTEIRDTDQEDLVDIETLAAASRTRTYASRLDHDRLGRLVSQTDPGGHETKLFYDSMDRLRGQIDEQGRLTTMLWDGLGRMKEQRTGTERVTFEHTPAGSVAFSKGNRSSQRMEYDPLGRPLFVARVAGGSERGTRTKRDAAGNPELVTDANGTRIRTVFDALGRPTEVQPEPADLPHLHRVSGETYRYDGLGRLVRAELGQAVVERSYDGLGRLLRETQTFRGNAQTVSHAYDEGFERETLTYPAASAVGRVPPSVELRYDALGRVVRSHLGRDDLADYRYAGPDRVASRRSGNTVQTHYRYDEERRPQRVVVGSELAGRTWEMLVKSYDGHEPLRTVEGFPEEGGGLREFVEVWNARDPLGRPVRTRTETTTFPPGAAALRSVAGETLRRYDERGRVDAIGEYRFDEQGEKFASLRADVFRYDGFGDVESVTTRYRSGVEYEDGDSIATGKLSAVEQLAADDDAPETQKFEFDANGNLVRDGRFNYFYDHRNRITKVYDRFKRKLGPIELRGTFPNFYADYTYDALGRRVHQAFRPRVTELPGNRFPDPRLMDARFLYDGQRLLAEVDFHPETGAGALRARYFHGGQGDEVVRMDRRADENPGGDLVSYWFHEGGSGEVRFLSDRLGAVVDIETKDDGVVEEQRIAAGTKTRVPYSTWTTRHDAFSGLRYDESRGEYVFDYRSAPRTLGRGLPEDEFFKKRDEALAAREAQRQAFVIGVVLSPVYFHAVSLLPSAIAGSVALSNMLHGGLLGVGIDHSVSTLVMGDSYSAEKGAIAFGLGLASGGTGSIAAKLFGKHSALAVYSSFAADMATESAFDMAYYGRSWQEALVSNLGTNVIKGAVGMTIGRVGGFIRRAADAPMVRRTRSAAFKARWMQEWEFPKWKTSDGRPIEFFDIRMSQISDPAKRRLYREMYADMLRLVHKGAGKSSQAAKWLIADIRAGKAAPRFGVTDALGTAQKGSRGKLPYAVNPENRASIRTPEALAGTAIHEYLHTLGKGELMAHKLQIDFLIRINGTSSELWPLATQYFKLWKAGPTETIGRRNANEMLRRHLLDYYDEADL